MLTAAIYMLLGETCVGAKPTADIYSTRNILLSRETVFIVEFFLKCNNNVKVFENVRVFFSLTACENIGIYYFQIAFSLSIKVSQSLKFGYGNH